MSKILDHIRQNYKPSIKEFSENLIRDGLPIIGITVPECRSIAKELINEDYEEILKEKTKFHEEKLIKGLMIGYLKKPFSEIETLLKDFLHEVDNWAICDSTVSTLKIFKKNQKAGLSFIDHCFELNQTYSIRFAYVLLLNYYLEEEYLDYIFIKITNEKSKEYYVQMAIAWLISYLFIKFPEKTICLFDGRLDKFTNNKAISKIKESFRVTQEQKEMIEKYRIKR